MNSEYFQWALSGYRETFQPSIIQALAQGAWQTFVRGDYYFDGNLWTMKYEFHGSLLVFGLSAITGLVIERRFAWIAFVIPLIVFRYADHNMIPFVIGMAIAYWQSELCHLRRPTVLGTLLVVGLYLLHFDVPEGDPKLFHVAVWTIGASFIIIAVLESALAERIFDNPTGAALGFLSFPIYLLHPIILCSAGAMAYMAFGSISAGVTTIGLTLLLAWPLGALDRAWVRLLNRIARSILKPVE